VPHRSRPFPHPRVQAARNEHGGIVAQLVAELLLAFEQRDRLLCCFQVVQPATMPRGWGRHAVRDPDAPASSRRSSRTLLGSTARQQVGVVAVAQERFRVGPDDVGVQVWHDRDPILAADSGQDGPNFRIGKGGHQVRCPGLRRSAQLAGGGIFDGDQAGGLRKPAHCLLVDRWRESGCGKRGRKHGDFVADTCVRRLDELERHVYQLTTLTSYSVEVPLSDLSDRSVGRTATGDGPAVMRMSTAKITHAILLRGLSTAANTRKGDGKSRGVWRSSVVEGLTWPAMGVWFPRVELSSGERIFYQAAGDLFAGRRQIGVRITVTDRRLLIVPNRLDAVFGGRRVQVGLDQVDQVRTEPSNSPTARRRGLSARIRPQVEVSSGGNMCVMTVVHPAELVKALEDAGERT